MGGDGHSQTRIQCRDDRVFLYMLAEGSMRRDHRLGELK